jgi:hypothetical protein
VADGWTGLTGWTGLDGWDRIGSRWEPCGVANLFIMEMVWHAMHEGGNAQAGFKRNVPVNSGQHGESHDEEPRTLGEQGPR